MPEGRMVDRARDRLIVATVLAQRLHDKLHSGRMRPEQADTAMALVLAQLERALALVEEASGAICGQPTPEPAVAWATVPSDPCLPAARSKRS